MLIVNYKVLNANTTDPELKKYSEEYQRSIKELLARYPSGVIRLQRNGYPKNVVQGPDPNMPIMPEVPAPIYIKYTRTVDGVYWGYCKGRAKIEANGLADVPDKENGEEITGEVLGLDLRSKPDYAFYILQKSGLLGAEFHIHDPEGDKLNELREKNARLKVQSSIRDMEEEKLRMISGAWGIADAAKKDVLLLQDEIETKVFANEARKKKEPDNLMLKGVPEFLLEIKNDEATRPRAIIQYGIDEGRLKFTPSNSHYYFDGGDVCYIPVDKQDRKEEELAKFLHDEKNKEKWINILKGLITSDYINKSDKYALRWLGGQVGVALNKKEDDLREALLAEFIQ